jgi:hypothetical protein
MTFHDASDLAAIGARGDRYSKVVLHNGIVGSEWRQLNNPGVEAGMMSKRRAA